MKYLLFVILFSMNAVAGNQDQSKIGYGNNINNCNPTLKCESRFVYATEKQRVRITELEAEVAKLKKENENLRSEKLVVQNKLPAPVVVVEKEEAPKNSVSLLGAASPTNLVTQTTPTGFNAKTTYQPDAGLMYQRDFGLVRGSIGATVNGTALVGVGFNF